MKKLRAIIVDDERLARKELREMLNEYEGIEVVAEADNADAARELIEKDQPDVVFLDIQMPGDSGFDLINSTSIEGKVIFVTAFDEYAIRAFDINALDYLLKPINPDRLKKAIEKLNDDSDSNEELRRTLEYNDRLFLSINNSMLFIKVDSIISIQSAGDYSQLFITEGQKGLTLKTMKEWEQRLPDKYFTRIHRSTIVNLECIEKLEEWFNGSYRVYMKGLSEPLVMSRRYAAKLKNKLS